MGRDHLHLKTLKRMIGVVVSTSMDRTAVVAIPRLRMHRRTQRITKQVTRFFCHDNHEICGVGDKVEIKFCGQVSKKKFWTVIDILQRFPQLEGEPFPQSRLLKPPVVSVEEAASTFAPTLEQTLPLRKPSNQLFTRSARFPRFEGVPSGAALPLKGAKTSVTEMETAHDPSFLEAKARRRKSSKEAVASGANIDTGAATAVEVNLAAAAGPGAAVRAAPLR